MANKRDVTLVIRARDEAQKAVKSVTKALDEITKSSKELQAGGKGTSSTLSQIGDEIKKLNASVRGSSVFEQLAEGSRKAEESQKRLQGELESTRQAQARLERESRQLENEQSRLGVRSTELTQKYRDQQRAAERNKETQKELRREYNRTNRAQQGFPNKIQSARDRVNTHTGAILGGEVTAQRVNQLDKAQSSLRRLEREAAENAARLRELGSALQGAENVGERLAASQKSLKNELKQTSNQYKTAGRELSSMDAEFAKNAQSIQRTEAALAEVNGEFRELQASTAQAEAGLDRIGRTLRTNVIESYRKAQVNMERYGRAQRGLQANLQGLAKQGVGQDDPQFQRTAARAKAAKVAYRELQMAVETMRREIRAAGTDTEKLAAANRKFEAIKNRVVQQVKDATGAVQRQERAFRGAGNAAGTAATKTRLFGNSLDLVRRHSRQTLSWTERLRGQVVELALAYGGLFAAIEGTRGVAHAYMTLEAAQNRLGAVFDQNQQRVSQEIDWLFAQADRLGIAFGTLADSYTKFSVAANAANYQSEATRRIFMSVAEAGRVNKLSMEQMNGIFVSLEQMISKGKIASEELRRQLGDRLPGAFKIMSDALGVTTGELDNMLRAGEVVADQDTLLKFADQLDQRFGQQLPDSLETFTTLWGRLQNEIFGAQLRAGQGGLISGLTAAMKDLIEYLQSADGQQLFNNLGALAGAFARALGFVIQNLDKVVELFAILVGVKASKWVRALGTDIAGLNRQIQIVSRAQRIHNIRMRNAAGAAATMSGSMVAVQRGAIAAAGAMRALRIVMAAFGGSIGLIVTGASVLFANWITSADDATDATAELERQLRRVRDAYNGAKEGAKDWREELDKVTVTQAQVNTEKLREQVETQIKEALDTVTPGFFDVVNPFGDEAILTQGVARIREAIEDLGDEFQRTGTVDIEAFQKRIDQLAQTNPELKELASKVLDLVDSADAGQNSLSSLMGRLRQSRLLLKALTGNADESAQALRDLQVASEELEKAQRNLGDAIDGAYAKWAEARPKTAEDERLKQIRELRSVFDDMANTDYLNVEGAAVADLFPWMDDDSQANIQRFLDLVRKVQGAVADVNREAAQKAVSGSLIDRIVGVESGGDPTAQNPDSSAAGLGQFIKSTWLSMFKRYFPDRAKGLSDEMIYALRSEADLSRQMVELYAQENAKVLQKAGVAVNDAALYLAHFLGPNGALKVLQAAPDTPVDQLLGKDQIEANQSVLGGGATAGDVTAWAQQRIGVSEQELKITQELAKLDKERADAQQDFNAWLATANADRRFAAEQSRLELEGKEKEAAIREEIRKAEAKAQKDNVAFSAQQKADLRETVALQWEAANAGKAQADQQRKIEDQVSRLRQMRQDIQEASQYAQQRGDSQAVAELDEQYRQVTERLKDAIRSAIQFWETVGGPEAEAKLASLKLAMSEVQAGVSGVGREFLMSGEDINRFTADLGASAFQDFADSIAAGEKATRSLSMAFRQFAADFLRRIAQMILQQAIFNALKAAGFGGGIGGGIGGLFSSGSAAAGGQSAATAALFHSGGVVGARRTTTRSVPAAAWAANAVRYHSGGIAGLKPNEVPAVLERNEEVLTENDPRHRGNGGQTAAEPRVRIVNAIDAGSFVESGLNSPVGEKAIMNFMKANRQKVKGVLG